ncbi:uncharacterized protein B0J16DRAFT_395843 [Fusarium flagelliforme]|uniref:uncharacterized protein n=1 Tax=Fusarium flagelliforme TaxID=2675880 RepID=UPI001E8E8BF6|nr:uncharacterized protein B0J16DRAFT_395843 [Fusarium flagelliforme]KAH7193852.1 hypothetical protein B0J16DRAFT_395843 [Fusarium flagelliforme]
MTDGFLDARSDLGVDGLGGVCASAATVESSLDSRYAGCQTHPSYHPSPPNKLCQPGILLNPRNSFTQAKVPRKRTILVMSGFEVAGIVLGSLPLVVTALQAYCKFMRDWSKTQSELKSLDRQLNTERAKLYNVCYLLINDVVPQGEIESMLQNPFGPRWRVPRTNNRVRRILWESYGAIEQTITEMKEALDSIMRRLRVQISPDGQVEWVNKGRMTREFKKFLYRLRRDDYKDDIAVISRSISDLESLIRLSVRLEPSRKKQSRGKLFKILRDLSTSVYRALCSSILCTHPHDLSLELSPRLIEIGYECEDEKVLREAEFKMLISFEMVEGPATKRFWDEVNIKTANSATTTAPQDCLPQPEAKRIKRISFDFRQGFPFMGSSDSTQSVGSVTATMSRPFTDIAFIRTCPEDGKQKQPLNLCMALINARTARPLCYGHLIDKECADRRFEVCPLGTTVNSDCWSVVTLDDILKGTEGLRPLVSLAEKIRLALAISSSVLQLSKTPWLPEALTRKNVHFFRRDDTFSYKHPFLLRNFQATPVQPLSTTQQRYLGNPTLFALGILLLEIILGQSFEQLRSPFKQLDIIDPHGIIHDSIAAHKLLERVALINPAYQAIVQRCIDCIETRGLDDDAFRQEVYNDVVMELEAIVDSTKIGM